MTSTIGWYGPLIDLSQAASHVGDFVVQLIVFVHCSTPVQVSLSLYSIFIIRVPVYLFLLLLIIIDNCCAPSSTYHRKVDGGRWDAAVFLSFFVAKAIEKAFAGDVVLLQSKDISSLQCSIHPYESLISKGTAFCLSQKLKRVWSVHWT